VRAECCTERHVLSTLTTLHCTGSPAKAKRVLGWEPKITFHGLVQDMMKADLAEVDTGKFDPKP
jgi:GDP-D-mannose dehydratase